MLKLTSLVEAFLKMDYTLNTFNLQLIKKHSLILPLTFLTFVEVDLFEKSEWSLHITLLS